MPAAAGGGGGGGSGWQWWHVDVLELARQWTLVDWKMFTSIPSWEFKQQAWAKPKHEVLAANPNHGSRCNYSACYLSVVVIVPVVYANTPTHTHSSHTLLSYTPLIHPGSCSWSACDERALQRLLSMGDAYCVNGPH
jgi:hypothetical protein